MAWISIAVLSDLHCQACDTGNDSFVRLGSPRVPSAQNPVASLLELIGAGGLQADLLLIPGDLTNKASAPGLELAWYLTQEISTALNAAAALPVLGNHDVDSRAEHGFDPFERARTLHPHFPFREPVHKDAYFAAGSTVLSYSFTHGTQVIAINSVVAHYSAEVARSGSFAPDRIASLSQQLSSLPPAPIRIALLHHHPILHDSPVISSADVLTTGDSLLSMLAENGCGLVIHGHKHHPRLRYADTAHGRLPVFAAGSFGAMLGLLSTMTRNCFHIVRVTPQDTGLPLKGSITTWQWRFASGWAPANASSCDFPHRAGFGDHGTIPDIASQLDALVRQHPAVPLSGDVIRRAVPDVDVLTPAEFSQLAGHLASVFSRGLHETQDGDILLSSLATGTINNA